jgi:hypothetical protein
MDHLALDSLTGEMGDSGLRRLYLVARLVHRAISFSAAVTSQPTPTLEQRGLYAVWRQQIATFGRSGE